MKTKRKARLSSIGDKENSLYFALKHREREEFCAFEKNYDVIKGALVEYDGEFFSLAVYGAGVTCEGTLMLNRIAWETVNYGMSFDEIMYYLKELDCLSLSELLNFPSFLRRELLKAMAHCAFLLKKGDEANRETLSGRMDALGKMLEDIRDGETYAAASAAYHKLLKVRGFDIYDDESRRRCIYAFSELAARSGMDEEGCIDKLNELCERATGDVFLIGRRRRIYAKAIGARIREGLPSLPLLRLILIVLPTLAGGFIAALFENGYARLLYAMLLAVCAHVPIFSYLTDVISDYVGDRRPCAAKSPLQMGELRIPEGCFISGEDAERLYGIRALYGCGRVLTERRISLEDDASLMSELLESGDDNRLFYSLLGINSGDCGLFCAEGEGDIFDSQPTVLSLPSRTVGEHIKRKRELFKKEMDRRPESGGEALMKLSHILGGCYPLCAMALLLLSCLQRDRGEMLLMQLCAAVPMVISGWMGFSRRTDELLRRKGSSIGAADIRRVLRRDLISSLFRLLLLPVYGAAFMQMTEDNRGEKGLRDCIRVMKPCIVFACVYFVFSFAARGGVTILGIFWTAVYLVSPIIIWLVQKV